MVDITFTQVPAYQVDGGRDQASAPIGQAGKASLLQANAAKAVKSTLDQGLGKTKAVAGPTAAAVTAGAGKTAAAAPPPRATAPDVPLPIGTNP